MQMYPFSFGGFVRHRLMALDDAEGLGCLILLQKCNLYPHISFNIIFSSYLIWRGLGCEEKTQVRRLQRQMRPTTYCQRKWSDEEEKEGGSSKWISWSAVVTVTIKQIVDVNLETYTGSNTVYTVYNDSKLSMQEDWIETNKMGLCVRQRFDDLRECVYSSRHNHSHT